MNKWMYLYRSVDSEGSIIDFYLSKIRTKQAAKRFFKKNLAFSHISTPLVITVDKNPAYSIAIQELKKMPQGIQVRKIKYLNNISGQYGSLKQTLSGKMSIRAVVKAVPFLGIPITIKVFLFSFSH
jgi:transposase-like protein